MELDELAAKVRRDGEIVRNYSNLMRSHEGKRGKKKQLHQMGVTGLF